VQGGFRGPADERGSQRPVAAADPGGGGGVRALADHGADEAREAREDEGGTVAAVDEGPLRISGRSRTSERPCGCEVGGVRGGDGRADVRVVPRGWSDPVHGVQEAGTRWYKDAEGQALLDRLRRRAILQDPTYTGTTYGNRLRSVPSRGRVSALLPVGPGQSGVDPVSWTPNGWVYYPGKESRR